VVDRGLSVASCAGLGHSGVSPPCQI
jgi:hypothetical protein